VHLLRGLLLVYLTQRRGSCLWLVYGAVYRFIFVCICGLTIPNMVAQSEQGRQVGGGLHTSGTLPDNLGQVNQAASPQTTPRCGRLPPALFSHNLTITHTRVPLGRHSLVLKLRIGKVRHGAGLRE